MEIKKIEKGGSRIEFEISIEWKVVKGNLKDVYDGMERYVKTSGFRKGKIPRSILEVKFSKEAEHRAIKGLIEKTADQILNNEKIKPLAGPWVNNVNFKKENPLSFNIEMEVMPNLEILNYKDIKLSPKKIKIDDKEIEKHLEILRKEKGELREKDGKIKKGDTAVVDLISYPPSGKPVEHLGLYIEIGASSFPPALEKELLDLSKNDEKTFEIEMSRDIKDEKLAGKMVKFNVSILGVKERILPKLDDDFAKYVGDFKNIKELKARIKENLTKLEEEKERENMKNEMIEELLKKTPFDAPESLIIEEHKRMFLTFLYNLERENIPFERFLSLQNKKREEFHKELKIEAGKKVRTLLILEKIADCENISVSDIEYEEWVKRSFSKEAIKEALSPEKRKTFKKDLRIEKTLDFLVKK